MFYLLLIQREVQSKLTGPIGITPGITPGKGGGAVTNLIFTPKSKFKFKKTLT